MAKKAKGQVVPQRITPDQARFLAHALAHGEAKAVVISGIDEATLAEWRKQPLFSDYENNMLLEHITLAKERAQQLLAPAFDELANLIKANKGIGADNRTRIQAIELILKVNEMGKSDKNAETQVTINMNGFDAL